MVEVGAEFSVDGVADAPFEAAHRAGDRQANSALWRIVITRLSYDAATRNYLQRRCAEGKTKTEAIRCLKRYVARDLYACLPRQPLD